MTVELRVFLIGIAIGLTCGGVAGWDYAYGVKLRAERLLAHAMEWNGDLIDALARLKQPRGPRGRFAKREAR